MFSQTGTESLRKASGSIAEVRGRKECREMDMKQIQPAVKNETKHVALYTAIGTVVMWVLFAVLPQHLRIGTDKDVIPPSFKPLPVGAVKKLIVSPAVRKPHYSIPSITVFSSSA